MARRRYGSFAAESAMKIRLRKVALVGAVTLVLPLVVVQACGPDFEPDVFVRTDHPDDLHAFAEGRLGILQARYDSNEYAVAYRYLNGGKLSVKEREAYAPSPQTVKDWTGLNSHQLQVAQQEETAATPVGAWLAARKEALAAAGAADNGIQGLPEPNAYYSPEQLNCPKGAFSTAVLTIHQRTQTWGARNPWLIDWLHAQDAVFTNCGSKAAQRPSAAPSTAPPLLRADRAYQSAAADFYARKYDDARAAFEAIAKDTDSPWRAWGAYLAARSVVRHAFSMGPKSQEFSLDLAGFDMGTMREAQRMLEKLAAQPPNGLPREAVEGELDFVRIRTEPDLRLAEICAALAGPAPDGRLKQDLDDLSFILVKNVQVTHSPELLDWIKALRSGDETAALAHWRITQARPWLVAAMMQADESAPAELLDAAAEIPPADPAFETTLFHRIRLLTASGHLDQARSLADSALQSKRPAASSDRNLFLGERMQLARTFDELLEYAPRTVIEPASSGWFATGGVCGNFQNEKDRPRHCVENVQIAEFDSDASAILNEQTPLPLLVQAAQSSRLPQNMRDEVAMAAWTRSVLLDDAASAAKLAPMLPATLRDEAGTQTGFRATLALLHNPGLRPIVEPGYSRLITYDTLDDFHNNWWCSVDQASPPSEKQSPDKPTQPKPLPYLSVPAQKQGTDEYQRILGLPSGPTLLGRRAIEYAKAHPEDPDVPEALALTVRATRYGCLTWGRTDSQTATRDNSQTSKAAFQLLHSKYGQSPWAAKTKYYY
jgi:hypothetical protein